jgi:NADH:ubiquinone oxidoreductase subunit
MAGTIASADAKTMTIGTMLLTWLFGELVGTDEFGNRYFRSTKLSRYGRERRWVVYKGITEASKVPAEWHAWLHHMVDKPLAETTKRRWPWQKPHLPNLTGTPYAYRPKGHDLRGGQRAHATGDYEPWVPD